MRKEKSNYLPDILLILFTPKMPSEGATKAGGSDNNVAWEYISLL